MPAPQTPPAAKAPRDIRLDFFRGLSMFIIFVAHVPANSWFLWIPARFGFSSAAELFVFCSGLASAYAFGAGFLARGFLAGTARVAHRIWQVYWAHIGLFLGLAAASALGLLLTGVDYPDRIGLAPFYAQDGWGVLGMMALTIHPAYTDILPIYMVMLAMIPAAMALARVSRWLAVAALVGLWFYANLAPLNLPKQGGEWFFNPFAWQLMFFCGFAFGMGWLPAPKLARGALFNACLAFVLVSVPLNFWAIVENVAWIDAFRDVLLPPGNQTYLNPFRFFHFLALAYVVLVLVEPHRAALARMRPVVLVGQQSLATFLASTVLIWVAGMALDWTGRDPLSTALVNVAGFAVIIAVAHVAAYVKAKPGPLKPAALKPAPVQVDASLTPRLSR